MDFLHVPVLFDEVLSSFDNKPSVFVDLTSGGGGHDAGILEKYPDVSFFFRSLKLTSFLPISVSAVSSSIRRSAGSRCRKTVLWT